MDGKTDEQMDGWMNGCEWIDDMRIYRPRLMTMWIIGLMSGWRDDG